MAGSFASPLTELKEYNDIKAEFTAEKGPLLVSGLVDTQKVHLIHDLAASSGGRVVITYNDRKARELYEDFRFFEKKVYLYPAKDLLFYHADIQGNQLMKERLSILKETAAEKDFTLITTIDGCMDRILTADTMLEESIAIEEGQTIELEALSLKLVNIGYERQAQVTDPGQFCIRGGIIDIYPLTEEFPVRIELWDIEVDSIRYFDVDSQRSIEKLSKVCLYPAKDFIAGKPYGTLLSFHQNPPKLFLDEPARLIEKAGAVEMEFNESRTRRLEDGYEIEDEDEWLISTEQAALALKTSRTILLCGLDQRIKEFPVTKKYQLTVKGSSSYQNSFEWLIKDLKAWKHNGSRVVLLSGSRTRAERLARDLRDEYDLNAYFSEEENKAVHPGEILVMYGSLHKGFEYPLIKFMVITEGDMFGSEKKAKKKKTTKTGQKISGYQELSIGDYVIHENHGLGIYQGIEQIEVEHIMKDYLKVEYQGGSNLYLPVTNFDLLQKYSSAGEGRKIKLNRLGGAEWKRTKSKVKNAVMEIADGLVKLYAARQAKKGFVYSKDTVWQQEFEELFPYDETSDQLSAIAATKRDMESERIMDRLICGDVGYGKTEIAIRAAFKAVQDGKQVAYLVPTTILAQQHYNNFTQRMMNYPVRVELLSRFRSASEQKKVIADLKKGAVDILIGTHRILSKDVFFKDLGLLVVDEEQRFGVTHKEKIKQLKENVDVLTLTATPIPRTLHMSLIGIRDMSVLEQAPQDRVPIQTYVMEYHDEMVREAIERELDRGGQIYYVYNRVKNIEEISSKIASLVPEATVVFAHGQMNERQLENIMVDFINGDIDVLVSTTIIETGLDISNVNTIIIHDADRFGLSQLYQLRGRVGRSNRTAYAFLMYKRDKMLKEEAEKRLQAIREFAQLGSGIKIAMRDLEIRGSGNVLGAEQHGHMEAVGYDLYCKMLSEAVAALKGVEERESFETSVDLPVDAYIPSSYIANEVLKMQIYKQISLIENEDDYLDMQDELIDRFGELPKAVETLLKTVVIKGLAHQIGITEVVGNKTEVQLIMFEKAPIKPTQLPSFIEKYQGRLKFQAAEKSYFTYFDRANCSNEMEEMLKIIYNLLKDMKESLL